MAALPNLRLTEWIETYPEPTIKRKGVQQYRTCTRERLAAYCLTCGEHREGSFIDVIPWGRHHRCDVESVAALTHLILDDE